MVVHDQAMAHPRDDSLEQACEENNKSLDSNPFGEVFNPFTESAHVQEVPDTDPATVDQLWKIVSKVLESERQLTMAGTTPISKRAPDDFEDFKTSHGITVVDSGVFSQLQISSPNTNIIPSININDVCMIGSNKDLVRNLLNKNYDIDASDFRAFITEYLFKQPIDETGTYGMPQRVIDYEADATKRPTRVTKDDKLKWYAPPVLHSHTNHPESGKSNARGASRTQSRTVPSRPAKTSTGTHAKGNGSIQPSTLLTPNAIPPQLSREWHVQPYIFYAFTKNIFSGNSTGNFDFLPHLRKTLYPYLTVQVVPDTPNSLHEDFHNYKQPLLFGIEALYNRWFLADYHKKLQKEVQQPPQHQQHNGNSAGAAAPSNRDSGPAATSEDSSKFLLHFVILVSPKEWRLVEIKPQDASSPSAAAGAWSGVVVERCQAGATTDSVGLDCLNKAVRKIHEWGSSTYLEACKRDIKAIYKMKGGDPEFVSPEKARADDMPEELTQDQRVWNLEKELSEQENGRTCCVWYGSGVRHSAKAVRNKIPPHACTPVRSLNGPENACPDPVLLVTQLFGRLIDFLSRADNADAAKELFWNAVSSLSSPDAERERFWIAVGDCGVHHSYNASLDTLARRHGTERDQLDISRSRRIYRRKSYHVYPPSSAVHEPLTRLGGGEPTSTFHYR
ncbi:hypothetical protein BU26DRAFT_504484 [Trematosphaeria pertusa]|uniref:Uncharacterized protein n=1 Tax=Trematosphaeria pertusa TaxID=390896 RepID=A0A6A6II51_9PLEO|nr:uncharacterized protein BU26DRAFT_504484 [Trematosphaeria pertusa]KAF2250091.1 hypothetical protein BU26DRAFT_504484 [Trematosphaeria pertusa]